MNENYSAEDFARATLATRGDYDVARRIDPDDDLPWLIFTDRSDIEWSADEHMARDGWTPVVESQVTEHTLRHVEERAERKRERLVDHIADQDRVIRRRNDEIAALRERVRVAESGRLSLARLAEAWEAAEEADECREGDVLIEGGREDSFAVWSASGSFPLPSRVRALSRAPREPWQDLADVLRREFPEGNQTAMPRVAKQMHAEGWRKGGDES